MTHGEKRRLFTSCLADLVMEMNRRGYGVAIKGAGEVDLNPTITILRRHNEYDEVKRLLESYHMHKANSYHYRDLAVDLDLYKDGEYLSSGKDHEQFGEYWMGLNKLCSWFKYDGNHYSLGER